MQQIIQSDGSRAGTLQMCPGMVFTEKHSLRDLQDICRKYTYDLVDLLLHNLSVQNDPEWDKQQKECDDRKIFEPFCLEYVMISETVHICFFRFSYQFMIQIII